MVAATPEVSQMWPRSATSPSETSIAALAMPRSALPKARRGRGVR